MLAAGVLTVLSMASLAAAQAALEPIRQVSVGKNAELRVNGKPFLPSCLAGRSRYYAAIKATNVNTRRVSRDSSLLTSLPMARRHGRQVLLRRRLRWRPPAEDYQQLFLAQSARMDQGDEPDLARTVGDRLEAEEPPLPKR
jgi:hypothetical protein